VQALSWAIYRKHAEQIQQALDDVDRALDLVADTRLAELIRRYVTQVTQARG
jgi:CRISPR/Cas system-associated protein Csm6